MSTRRTLEIHLCSAEGLTLNRKPITRKTFAVARIGEKSRISSDLDESGGSNPIWNYKSEMLMDNVKFIFIEVFYRTRSGREKKIGEAKIPVTDFIGRYSREGHLNFLSYRLRDEFGDKCGIVNVSIMVKPISIETNSSSSSSSSSSSEESDKHTAATMKDYGGCSSQATEMGLWRGRKETPSIDGYGGRIVTGVPIWCVIQQRPP